MLKPIFTSLLLCLTVMVGAQVSSIPRCMDHRFHEEVADYTTDAVDLIDVADVNDEISSLTLLDAREKEEYAVSHIPGAEWIGYDDFQLDRVDHLDKARPVVVYCSIGYRSEQVGKKLKEAGFQKVYNLYGSIFEWGNRGLPLVGSDGKATKQIHTYNRKWSKWVLSDELEKVW